MRRRARLRAVLARRADPCVLECLETTTARHARVVALQCRRLRLRQCRRRHRRSRLRCCCFTCCSSCRAVRAACSVAARDDDAAARLRPSLLRVLRCAARRYRACLLRSSRGSACTFRTVPLHQTRSRVFRTLCNPSQSSPPPPCRSFSYTYYRTKCPAKLGEPAHSCTKAVPPRRLLGVSSSADALKLDCSEAVLSARRARRADVAARRRSSLSVSADASQTPVRTKPPNASLARSGAGG